MLKLHSPHRKQEGEVAGIHFASREDGRIGKESLQTDQSTIYEIRLEALVDVDGGLGKWMDGWRFCVNRPESASEI